MSYFLPSRNVRFGKGSREFRFRVRLILIGVAPKEEMQGRCDGVGSGVNGSKPSVQDAGAGIHRGVLFWKPDLFW
jgi:hypothetical protein